ncbi:MAG: VanZ like family [Frankiales bacterium]|nr:VanZ like family [Frankiales bacterium]
MLAGYVLLPLVLTLTSTPLSAGLNGFYRLARPVVAALTLGQVALAPHEAEALANVLLFMPLGALLPLAVPRTPLPVLLGGLAALSLALEVAQDALLASRSPSLRDVLNNVGGAAIAMVLQGQQPRARARGSSRDAAAPPGG